MIVSKKSCKVLVTLIVICLSISIITIGVKTLTPEKPELVKKIERLLNISGEAHFIFIREYYDPLWERKVIWIHWKTPIHNHGIDVKIDAISHEILFYSNNHKRCILLAGSDIKISQNKALEKAKEFILKVSSIPPDFILSNCTMVKVRGCTQEFYYEYLFEWSRIINGISVEGELIRVHLHANTGEVVGYCKIYHGDKPMNSEVRISRDQAISIAKDFIIKKQEALIERGYPFAHLMIKALQTAKVEVKLKYVRFRSIQIEHGAPKGLWLCWIVKFTFTEDFLANKWVKIYVQATTGEVLYASSCK